MPKAFKVGYRVEARAWDREKQAWEKITGTVTGHHNGETIVKSDEDGKEWLYQERHLRKLPEG